jgi:acetylornithine deacetylase/succinyl-diaminopimelate desuccinylase-like protein
MADLCDVGMVFVRNASGRSHSPNELVELDDIERGARLLVATLARLAHHCPPGDR